DEGCGGRRMNHSPVTPPQANRSIAPMGRKAFGRKSSAPRSLIEPMEPRLLLSAAVSGTPLVSNATKLIGPHAEEAIAVNPTNPNQLFLATNDTTLQISTTAKPSSGIFTARSNDGGHTWSGLVLGTGTDGFAPGCCDASTA